jgi:hypothetical protein
LTYVASLLIACDLSTVGSFTTLIHSAWTAMRSDDRTRMFVFVFCALALFEKGRNPKCFWKTRKSAGWTTGVSDCLGRRVRMTLKPQLDPYKWPGAIPRRRAPGGDGHGAERGRRRAHRATGRRLVDSTATSCFRTTKHQYPRVHR